MVVLINSKIIIEIPNNIVCFINSQLSKKTSSPTNTRVVIIVCMIRLLSLEKAYDKPSTHN